MLGIDLKKLNSVVGAQSGALIAVGLIVLQLGRTLTWNAQGYEYSVHALAGLLIAFGVAKGLVHVFFDDSALIWRGILAGVTAGFAAGVVGGGVGYAGDPSYASPFALRLLIVVSAATPTGGLIGAACAVAANSEHDWKRELSVLCSTLILMATMAGVLLSANLPDLYDKGVEFGHLLLVCEVFSIFYLLIEALERGWRLSRVFVAISIIGCCAALGTIASFHRFVDHGVATTVYHMGFYSRDSDNNPDPEGSIRLILSTLVLICGTVLAYTLAVKGSLRLYDTAGDWRIWRRRKL